MRFNLLLLSDSLLQLMINSIKNPKKSIFFQSPYMPKAFDVFDVISNFVITNTTIICPWFGLVNSFFCFVKDVQIQLLLLFHIVELFFVLVP